MEEKLDKRTKEYKDWKAEQDKKSKGLGDTIEKITEATGIKAAVESVTKALGFDDCGCDERKKFLNEEFKYNVPECLEEDEYNYLTELFKRYNETITYVERVELYRIYNRIFHKREEVTSCSSCVRSVIGSLKRVLKGY